MQFKILNFIYLIIDITFFKKKKKTLNSLILITLDALKKNEVSKSTITIY